MIKSADRRQNLITARKVAKRALEVGALMVTRTKFNLNQ